jgi:shikimate 5-dehydrogenase
VTSAQGPPRSVIVIVSTVSASATTTKIPDTFFSLLSLFSADPGVVLDMVYYKLAETPLLRLAKTVVATGRWHSVMGVEVLLEQGYRQFKLWTGWGCPRGVLVSKTVLAACQGSAYAISVWVGSSWMRPHHRKSKKKSRVEEELVFALDVC